MKKLILFVLVITAFLVSCQKEELKQVVYRITNSASGFSVSYLASDGSLQTENITTGSAADTWTYSYEAEKGAIVFVSASYKDINSAVKVQVLIEGKIYKEGSSIADTTNFVTVSGTIPY